MQWKPAKCPNVDCPTRKKPFPEFDYRKRGSFPHKRTGKTVQRWQCKTCGRTFSQRTEAEDKQQRRPDINKKLMGLLCSGVTLRRAAELLDVTYNTIRRKFLWLAERSREAHIEILMNSDRLHTSRVQFDELITSEHSKAKPLTVALAVRARNGDIISARVGRVPANGKLAKVGQQKYGWTNDDRKAVCKAALREVEWVAKAGITIVCDGYVSYPQWIQQEIPQAVVEVVSGGGVGGNDPLFRVNHACALLRADVSRLARRTWATTKNRAMLQRHLDIYVAWKNKYTI